MNWIRPTSSVAAVGPAVVALIGAFVLGSLPMGAPPSVSFLPGDKIGHFFAFGVMQLTFLRAGHFLWPEQSWARIVGLSIVAASLSGGLLELWQFLLPHRAAEWADFLADSLGALVLGTLAGQWGRRFV